MNVLDVNHGILSYQAWATDPTPRIGFGLPFFDEATRGGIAKAECAMILAYSSVGKTSLGLNVIVNNPLIPTMFFSLEMSWRMVVARLAAIHTGVPTWEIEGQLRRGETSDALLETRSRYPYLLGNDKSELSIKEMTALVKEGGNYLGQQIRLVVIDYLELIGGAGMLGKAEQVDKAAQKIRSLAKDCDCSVIVLHQVSKGDGSGGHKPLSLDSGKFGGHHPMDYVVGAYAPRLDRELSKDARDRVQDELWLQLLKNRSGQAHPDGIKHRLNSRTGRLGGWDTQFLFQPRGYQPTFTDAGSEPDDREDFAWQ
ncbi:MAG TPA: DnaB-like helicase C-terminal domain-containing protein [Acidimicrobiia bacterium]|nr:DnaB-like helicase C-terminal domain-containing protein [Acidimicrobiia bacterium]